MLDLNKQLEEQIELYNKRIEAVNEKERQYDQLIAELKEMKEELRQTLQATKDLNELMKYANGKDVDYDK